MGIGIITYGGNVCITIAADHVKNRHSEGVARRLTSKFEQRWQQYSDVADEILARKERKKQIKK